MCYVVMQLPVAASSIVSTSVLIWELAKLAFFCSFMDSSPMVSFYYGVAGDSIVDNSAQPDYSIYTASA